MKVHVDVISAKLNRGGLFLKCKCPSDQLKLGENVSWKEFTFNVIQSSSWSHDPEVVYTVMSQQPDAYTENPQDWLFRILTLTEG